MKGIAATLGAVEGQRHFFWLSRNFAMRAMSPVRGLGSNLDFGGTFTSVPVAVFSMARGPLDDPVRKQRIDLFGLGLDYAMFNKVKLGDYDEDDFSPWINLGGTFTSAPAAIAWARDRVDVFGLGLDHAMYTKRRRRVGPAYLWTPDWQSLGGAFTSAASVVTRGPNLLELFVRGEDFTLRRNHSDGSTWFGWQNLGGNLASPPVAVSWGQDRVDVFAIFNDGTLRHTWWDGQLWNVWESLGGSYIGEPAVASWAPGRLDVFVVAATDHRLNHQRFSDNTWSLPQPLGQNPVAESATVISPAANRLEVYVPDNRLDVRLWTWDGQAWQGPVNTGAREPRLPSRYRISVDLVRVRTPRALNSDTDAASLSLAVGNWTSRTKTQWIGTIGGTAVDSSQTNLLEFEPATVDPAEAMSFAYLVVNNGHAPQDKILAALANAGDSLNLASVSSMEEDIGKGIVKFVSVKIQGALASNVPVIGSVIGAIASWALDKMSAAIFASCDGIVAAELRAMMGRDLFIMTENGKNTVTITTKHHGTDAPAACGPNNSDYDVTFTIKPL
jgi:hypothetical protein